MELKVNFPYCTIVAAICQGEIKVYFSYCTILAASYLEMYMLLSKITFASCYKNSKSEKYPNNFIF